MRPHVPKIDTGDDYEFMCGTHSFGATVSSREVCQSCIKRALEIVDLLAQAYDELAEVERVRKTNHFSQSPASQRRGKLLKRIDKVLGNRARVTHSEDAPRPRSTS